MTALIQFFFNISILRAKPQDLPSSSFLMITTVATYSLFSLMISAIELRLSSALLSAFADTALLISLAYVSLWIIGAPERRVKIITALAGTGSLLQLIAWPILFWLSSAGETPVDTQSVMLFFPRSALLLLVIWNILVIAHILRHALAVALPITFIISVLYMYFTIQIANILFIAAR